MLKPSKLLEKLSAKGVVSIMIQYSTDIAFGRTPAFSDAEVQSAINALDNEDMPEYKAYYEFIEIMEAVQYEAKIAALTTLWKLSVSNTIAFTLKEYDTDILKKLQRTAETNLKRFYILKATLKVIDDTLGCNAISFVDYEQEMLDSSLGLYNRLAGRVEDFLAESAYKRGKEIDDIIFFSPINTQTLQPSADIIEQITTCFAKPKGKSAWQVIDLLKANCAIS